MTDSLAQLRRHATAPDLALFDRLTATRSQLATLTLSGAGSPDYRSFRLKLERLEEQMEKTEAEISARSAEFKAQLQPVTLANVQSAIPAGAALVELAVYSPFDPRTRSFGSPRYVAYVITSSGLPRWAELGEAAGIDGAADDFRRALRSPKRSEIKRVARRVDEMAMRPIRALLGDARRVFISPYGSLNLIPFAALVDERNRYLVERYSFSYLTSGRDLLRLQSAAPSRSEPLIVADPAFGELAAATGRAERGLGLQANVEQNLNPPPDFSGIAFKPLPGVAGEAQSLRRLLPRARTLTGAQATETALKQTSGPSILHIATHGFFLKDAEVAAGNTRGFGLSLSHAPAIPGATLSDNPLLRSGLALAGANERRSGNDDGILTALEVAGLDLWGTKLVALSACNTGVGEVSRSEGVYGLRRALVLAGAETQVMSLWPVSDRGTRDLMIAYYRALTRGEGRSEALRQVQLRMLQSKGRRHPYYWASFIQSGEWKNLDGKEPGVK
jgi:CHAT domain-containing protein